MLPIIINSYNHYYNNDIGQSMNINMTGRKLELKVLKRKSMCWKVD